MVTLFIQLDQETARTYSLVLSAVGIGHRVIPSASGYRIDVPETDADRALMAVDRYRSENSAPPEPEDPHPYRLSQSAIAMALILLAAHLAVVNGSGLPAYVETFGADAKRIVAGELFRCVTALMLHADAAHLAGNMVGMVLFGGAVCAIAGGGVGWMLILFCGAAGNWINALVYSHGHLSVGASTAVFGAVGILCAIRSVDAIRLGRGWKRVVIIAGAGVALLAFLGTGPRSDLGAHLFGGAIGFATGMGYGFLIKHPPGLRWQILAGIASAAILCASWIRGTML